MKTQAEMFEEIVPKTALEMILAVRAAGGGPWGVRKKIWIVDFLDGSYWWSAIEGSLDSPVQGNARVHSYRSMA